MSRRAGSSIRSGALLTLGVAAPAIAEFVPGNLYISAVPLEFGGPNDRIYEFNPATGASREFAVLPDEFTPGLTGLVFTSDYSALRGSVFWSDSILEIDGNANVRVALDIDDGILRPAGSNNLAYDAAGNFYVVNSLNLMQFTADGSPGKQFADTPGLGPIATAPDNLLYYALEGDEETRLYTSPGQGELFDRLPEGTSVWSLAADSSGDLFAYANGTGLFRYRAGDPDSRELIAAYDRQSWAAAIALSADERTVYLVNQLDVFAIDAQSGDMTSLGSLPFVNEIAPGFGMALFVPEPSTFMLVLMLTAMPRVLPPRRPTFTSWRGDTS